MRALKIASGIAVILTALHFAHAIMALAYGLEFHSQPSLISLPWWADLY
jgi:hypothetical protein